MMGNLKVPFDLGQVVWFPGACPRKNVILCPDCQGQKYVILVLGDGLTHRLCCEGCRRGFDSPTGLVEELIHEFAPARFRCDEINVFGGEVRYTDTGQNQLAAADELFLDEEVCRAYCQEKSKEHERNRLQQALSRSKSRKRDYASKVSFFRQEVRRLEKDLARYRGYLDVTLKGGQG